MCTLILGRDVLGPGVTLLAANRDEDPARPSDPPGILLDSPRVAGGRDRRAGGTWLAVRSDAAVAMLNRRPGPAPPPAERSRGLLALDVAAVAESGGRLLDAAREVALRAVAAASYAPFTLAFVAPDAAWILRWDGHATVAQVPPGWHVLTHAELDDAHEPRTRRLLRELEGWVPQSGADAERGLRTRLSAHDDPRVCIHEGPVATVSYSLVTLAPEGVRYLHGEGRPCEQPLRDWTHLLR